MNVETLIRSLQDRLVNLQQKINQNVKGKELYKTEESIFYRLLMDEVRPENYTLLGLKKNQTITEEDKKRITDKLTVKRKAVIMRDFIHDKVVTHTTGSGPESDMLLSLVGEHFPEDLQEIEEEVAASYDSKEKKLDE